MRGFLSVLAALVVISLAYWAYHQNYATQAAIQEVRSLNREIGDAHRRLTMLKAEWAYLNRPDRLRDLAELNYKRLQLLPLMPEAFGRVDQVTYPQPEADEKITDPIQIRGDLPAPDGEYP